MAKSDAPKLSVIVPVLNGASSLDRTLNSILAQKKTNMEIIVIDGGSSDGTLEIIQQYVRNLAYWETGKDTGIADAFNRGIHQAKGELIAILNADDNWVPGTIEILERCLKSHPGADVYCGQICYIDEMTGQSYIRKPDLTRMIQRMYLFHPAIFVRKSAYESIGIYNTQYRLAMDSEWCHRAIAAKLSFQIIDQVMAQMRLGGRSDEQFLGSLWEYRKSLLQHRLISRWMADFYFCKFVLLKTIMQCYPLRRLKQKVVR